MCPIKILKTDICDLEVDAIVNAANSSLLGGGGVDGAIHRRGGPLILEECRTIRARQGGCKTGEAVMTCAGNLYAKIVIHTVGPVWVEGKEEPAMLRSCYKNSLELARREGMQSIAFPNISTGQYRFPKQLAATIALDCAHTFLEKNAHTQIVFCCFDEENFEIYNTLESEERSK